MRTMYSLFPFDNTLVTLKITGAKLKEQIDHLLTSLTAAGKIALDAFTLYVTLPGANKVVAFEVP